MPKKPADPAEVGKIDVVQVLVTVDGCVINWTTRQQYNPQTGQKFDFDGHLIDDKSAD